MHGTGDEARQRTARTEPGPDHRADVLVIGGGVIGLAIAWRAAQRGLRVVLADPAPGRGASHAAAGMLTPLAEAAYAERHLFELGLASLRSYPEFAAELTGQTGDPVGFRQSGTLQVAFDADDWAVLTEHGLLLESFGVLVTRLTGRECRQAEPMLAPSVRGGLLVRDDASVDPRLLTAALLRAALGQGVTHHAATVTALTVTAGRAAGATLADGSAVSAQQVVLAAGWQSGSLPGLPLGAMPPLRPVKGQILRLRATAATRGAGLPPALVDCTIRGVVHGSPVYLVPRASGELVVGATQEELGADTTVTAGGVWQLLRDARALVPGISELELAEAATGLRPGTPDNAPVLGSSRLPGLVLATGHFRAGVLLAPVTADLITEYLISDKMPAAGLPFGPDRFPAPEKVLQ